MQSTSDPSIRRREAPTLSLRSRSMLLARTRINCLAKPPFHRKKRGIFWWRCHARRQGLRQPSNELQLRGREPGYLTIKAPCLLIEEAAFQRPLRAISLGVLRPRAKSVAAVLRSHFGSRMACGEPHGMSPDRQAAFLLCEAGRASARQVHEPRAHKPPPNGPTDPFLGTILLPPKSCFRFSADTTLRRVFYRCLGGVYRPPAPKL